MKRLLVVVVFFSIVLIAFYRLLAKEGLLDNQVGDPPRFNHVQPTGFPSFVTESLETCRFDFKTLVDYLVMEPLVAVNETCGPPSLGQPNCTRFPNAFTGKHSVNHSKVAVLLQFGFDVDVLEIALNEYYDVADRIFITESTRQHRHAKFKPMILSEVLQQKRFSMFSDKIVSLVVDDSHIAGNQKGIWVVESTQEKYRFEAFVRWNAKNKVFSDNDIIGFGDADEIASMQSIHLLKSCQWKNVQKGIDVGIWFPRESIDWAFKTDWPVRGHPYSLGDPTYFKYKHALDVYQNGKYLNRNRGKSGPYVLGGMHMSDHPYVPFRIIKMLTCSECSGTLNQKNCNFFREVFQQGGVYGLAEFFSSRAHNQNKQRWVKREKIKPGVAVMPWFLKCNPDRYPYWFNRPDTRLMT